MSKEFLSQCQEVIHQAEDLRTKGEYGEAIELVKPARVTLLPELKFSDRQLSELMRAWRIDVVSHTSEAKRSLTGRRAVKNLVGAQYVIKRYYNHPQVLAKSREFDYDSEGNPYDFEVEMLRDKARYCLAAASITGDASFRLAALDFFDKALSLSKDQELIVMEDGIVKNDFEQISEAYHVARNQSEFLNNPDRARWMVRTYFGESVKRFQFIDSLIALQDLIKIRKNPVKVVADAVIGVVRSSNFLSAPLNFVRRKTLPKNFNPDSLKIS